MAPIQIPNAFIISFQLTFLLSTFMLQHHCVASQIVDFQRISSLKIGSVFLIGAFLVSIMAKFTREKVAKELGASSRFLLTSPKSADDYNREPLGRIAHRVKIGSDGVFGLIYYFCYNCI